MPPRIGFLQKPSLADQETFSESGLRDNGAVPSAPTEIFFVRAALVRPFDLTAAAVFSPIYCSLGTGSSDLLFLLIGFVMKFVFMILQTKQIVNPHKKGQKKHSKTVKISQSLIKKDRTKKSVCPPEEQAGFGKVTEGQTTIYLYAG